MAGKSELKERLEDLYTDGSIIINASLVDG
jgi:hypothetical protein